MSDPIRWDDDPSFQPTLSVQVHAPRSGCNSFLRLLGPHVGAFVHCVRDGRRKRPAACLKEHCPHCKKQEPLWKAYIPAYLYCRNRNPNWVPVVAELTESAFAELTKVLPPKEFRGKVIEVSRGQTNSKMHAKLTERPTADSGMLPDAFDVRIVLRRLWGLAGATTRREETFDPTPPPPIEALELPPAVPELPEPPEDRSKVKQILRAFMERNGGGK